jgi:hypothetical protein
MQTAMAPMLKAMHRVAKEHNNQPGLGLLAAKTPAFREAPADSEYSSGAWFMYHALNGTMTFIIQSINRSARECSSARLTH